MKDGLRLNLPSAPAGPAPPPGPARPSGLQRGPSAPSRGALAVPIHRAAPAVRVLRPLRWGRICCHFAGSRWRWKGRALVLASSVSDARLAPVPFPPGLRLLRSALQCFSPGARSAVLFPLGQDSSGRRGRGRLQGPSASPPPPCSPVPGFGPRCVPAGSLGRQAAWGRAFRRELDLGEQGGGRGSLAAPGGLPPAAQKAPLPGLRAVPGAAVHVVSWGAAAAAAWVGVLVVTGSTSSGGAPVGPGVGVPPAADEGDGEAVSTRLWAFAAVGVQVGPLGRTFLAWALPGAGPGRGWGRSLERLLVSPRPRPSPALSCPGRGRRGGPWAPHVPAPGQRRLQASGALVPRLQSPPPTSAPVLVQAGRVEALCTSASEVRSQHEAGEACGVGDPGCGPSGAGPRPWLSRRAWCTAGRLASSGTRA